MKKVVLMSFMFVGLLCGDDCWREKEEYKDAMKCYKYYLGQDYGEGSVYCSLPSVSVKYHFVANSIENARKWVELAKMDLDMCLMNR